MNWNVTVLILSMLIGFVLGYALVNASKLWMRKMQAAVAYLQSKYLSSLPIAIIVKATEFQGLEVSISLLKCIDTL